MRIIRIEEVKKMTGLSRSTIYRLMDKGGFPNRIVLSARSVGWVESEVIEWLQTKIDKRISL